MTKEKSALRPRKRTGRSKKAKKAFVHSRDVAKRFDYPDAEVIREASCQLDISVEKLEASVVADRLESEAFSIVETLVKLDKDKAVIAVESISEALDRFISSDEDPLDEVDKASEKEVLSGQIEAELKNRELRRMILAKCIGVKQAALLAKRSRQRLEKLRREKKLIALRVKNRWMYPRWQFDPDYSGGVLPGIGEALSHLQLSPAGAAAWLTTTFKDLSNHTPIELLRTGQIKDVIELAEEHGHMP